jgi:hypothetical protein
VKRIINVQGRDVNTPEKADTVLARIRGFDACVLCMADGRTIYPNSAVMQSYDYGGYDPLAYLTPRLRDADIEFYPWWCIGTAPRDATFRARYPELDIARLPDVPDDFHWLHFGELAAWDLMADFCLEIVERYDPTGVLLDVIRWPGTGETRPDWGWPDVFSAGDIMSAVWQVYRAVKADSPDTQVVASVMAVNLGRYHGQHWVEWLDAGIIDHVYPLAYVEDDPAGLDYLRSLTQAWAMLDRGMVTPTLKVYVGDGPGDGPKAIDRLQAEIDVFTSWGALGLSWFDEARATDEQIAYLVGGNMSPLDRVQRIESLANQLVEEAALLRREIAEADDEVDVSADEMIAQLEQMKDKLVAD